MLPLHWISPCGQAGAVVELELLSDEDELSSEEDDDDPGSLVEVDPPSEDDPVVSVADALESLAAVVSVDSAAVPSEVGSVVVEPDASSVVVTPLGSVLESAVTALDSLSDVAVLDVSADVADVELVSAESPVVACPVDPAVVVSSSPTNSLTSSLQPPSSVGPARTIVRRPGCKSVQKRMEPD